MTETSRSTNKRALCVAVDAEGYSGRHTAGQHDLQTALITVLNAATADAGLDRLAWDLQAQGDGELAVIPREQDERTVADDFVRKLDAQLDVYNAQRTAEARLRLRLSMHFGIAVKSENGYAGPAPVVVFRLLSSDLLHAALRNNPDSDLVVALSDSLYEDLILGRLTSLRPEAFASGLVKEAKYEGLAWIRVVRRESATASGEPLIPDISANAVKDTDDGTFGGPAPAATNSVVNHFQDAHFEVAGIQNNFGRPR